MRPLIALVGLALASPALASFAERYPEQAARICEADEANAGWVARSRQDGMPISIPMRTALLIKDPNARQRVIAITREAYAQPRDYYPEPDNPRERRDIEDSKRSAVRRFAEGVANDCWRSMTRD